MIEIDVLDPQLQRLRQAHTRPVQEARKKRVLAGHRSEHPADLIARKHDWQPMSFARTADGRQPWQFDLEHTGVKEKNRRQSLTMSRHRHPLVIRKPCEKRLDLRLPQMGWMTHVVEPEKLPNPEDVALFGPDAVVQIPDAFTDATKDGRRREQGVFRSPHNVGIDTVQNDSTTAPGGRILAVRMRRTGVLCGNESVLNGR